MAPNIAYEKDSEKKEVEKSRNVKYDCRGKEQRYSTAERDKDVEDRCCVKYKVGGGGAVNRSSNSVQRAGRGSTATKQRTTSHSSNSVGVGRPAGGGGGGGGGAGTGASEATKSAATRSNVVCAVRTAPSSEKGCDKGPAGYRHRKLDPLAVSAECYEVDRSRRKHQPCCEVRWQYGKYVRDRCGSGIVPTRFNFGPTKRLWCCTPLSMYQATIGELGKKLLCREKVIPRDVKPEPPCNLSEYIMPLCRGYYRKYDCIRPCEEEHAYVKRGKKYYRDRVERYWEPCLTNDQKHTLNLNEYGPHNAALAMKLRRENMGIPCW